MMTGGEGGSSLFSNQKMTSFLNSPLPLKFLIKLDFLIRGPHSFLKEKIFIPGQTAGVGWYFLRFKKLVTLDCEKFLRLKYCTHKNQLDIFGFLNSWCII